MKINNIYFWVLILSFGIKKHSYVSVVSEQTRIWSIESYVGESAIARVRTL